MRWILLGAVFLMAGCQTTPPHKTQESQAQTVSAMKTMAEGLTNQPMTDAQLKDLGERVSKDPNAQSAIHSINTALTPLHTVKYCPEDGERFSGDQIWCPDHKVKLEWLD